MPKLTIPKPTRPATAPAGATTVAPGYAPPKRRRNPLAIIGGIALIILAALAAALAYRSLGTGHDVVAARQTIHRGEVITREDLITVRIGIDPALRPLPADQVPQIVGRRAAVDVAGGGVLTQDVVTAAVIPASGSSLIGVQLTAAQLPSENLLAGDTVRLVTVPHPNQAPAAGGEVESIDGTVVQSRPSPRGDAQIVDVEIARAQAPTWAARAATGQVALVLETRQR